MEDISVLVADDSGLMRLIISDIINSAPGMKVIDTAADGKEAAEKSLRLKPDVLVLDMNMGEFGGLYAVKAVLEKRRMPILILSALGNTDMEPILEALRLGAFDYLNKPEKNHARIRDVDRQIVDKIRAAAASDPGSLQKTENFSKLNQYEHTFSKKLSYDVLAIGASTGGPTAIETLLTGFPSNFPVPILIAQHMPENFLMSFAERLAKLTPLKVVLGRKGMELLPGMVILAPGNQNMVIRRRLSSDAVEVTYTFRKHKEYNYPSINALLLSVAEVYGPRSVCAVLTGMGRDGTEGLLAVKEAGGYTLVQDKESCAVYGMPRAAWEAGAAKNAVPLGQMAGFITSCFS